MELRVNDAEIALSWKLRVEELEAEVERLQEQDEVHWKTRRHLVAEVERLRSPADAAHKAASDNAERANRAEAEVERLRAEVERAYGDAETYRAALNRVEAVENTLAARVDELQAAVLAAINRAERLDADRLLAEAEVESLRSSADAAHKAASDNAERANLAGAEVERLERSLGTCERELHDREREVARLRTLLTSPTATEAALIQENERLQRALDSVADQLAENARLHMAEVERLRAALEQIADKGKYGCCRPTLYPDAPVCSHDIARDALAEEKA